MMQELELYQLLGLSSRPGYSVGLPGFTPIRRYNFTLDSFQILNTRSKNQDTDFVSVSLAVSNGYAGTRSMSMGDLNNGIFPVNLYFDDVPVGDMHTAVFSYAITNNGNQPAPTALLAVENATKRLAQAAVQVVAKLAGEAAGAALGTEIGTAIVPLIGSALGALAGFIIGAGVSLLNPNCDGPVAVAIRPFTARDLQLNTKGQVFRVSDDHPGVNSAPGCGSNSHYSVNWSVAAA